MKPLAMLQLPFSSTAGWEELRRRQPSVAMLVICIVLPLSLIPPLMLYYAGTVHGDALAPGFGDRAWPYISIIFLLAQLLTFALMGWLIYEVGNTYGVEISIHDAYLLAAVAPIPLWLSALGLFIPSLVVNAVISLAALAIACAIVYHGLEGLCRTREHVEAMSVTHTVMAAAVGAWAVLMGLIWAL